MYIYIHISIYHIVSHAQIDNSGLFKTALKTKGCTFEKLERNRLEIAWPRLIKITAKIVISKFQKKQTANKI